MYIKNKHLITHSISLVLAAFCLLSGQAQAAKGSGGGTTTDPTCFGTAQGSGTTCNVRGVFPEFRSAGTCTLPNGAVDPNAKTTAVLRKSQGVWQFSMETVGTNASGTWLISYTKNGVPGASSMQDFANGWAAVLYNVTNEQGLIEFVATAVKVSQTGEPLSDTCTAKISMKF